METAELITEIIIVGWFSQNTPKNLNLPLYFINKPQSPMQTYYLMLLQVLNNEKPILASIVALN